jgi:hypothetical protein
MDKLSLFRKLPDHEQLEQAALHDIHVTFNFGI